MTCNILGKPSIFSKDYNKKMRFRKIVIVVTIIIIAILLVGFIFIGSISSSFEKIGNKLSSLQVENGFNESENTKEEEEEIRTFNNEINNEVLEEEKNNNIEINLTNGEKLVATIIKENNLEHFSEVKLSEDKGKAVISPDKTKLLINNYKTQELFIYDTKGNGKNISKTEYTTKNNKSYSRESILQSNNGFVWCRNPMFVSDNKIVYQSNLPFFGRKNLDIYVWSIDLNTNEHKTLWDFKGKTITFGELTDKGLQVNIDGNNKYIN